MSVADGAAHLIATAFTAPLRRPRRATTMFPETWSQRAVWLAVATIVLSAPTYASRYQLTIVVGIAFAIIGSIAMNILLGVAGQVSVGNAAFMAIGAFAAAYFAVDLHLPFVIAVLASGGFAGIVGVLIGIPAMRVRGLYLIIATFALHYVALYILNRYQSAQVGSGQFLMPAVTAGNLPSTEVWFYVMVVAAALSILVMRNLLRTRYGRAWLALARDEIAAEVLGINVRVQKITVFGLTSMIIGLQGALFAYYLGVVTTDSYSFDVAVSYVAMVIIGGRASTGGSVLGAMFVVAIPYVVTSLAAFVPTEWAMVLATRLFALETIVYGASIVIFLTVEPRGLIYLWNRTIGYFRSWPLSQNIALSTTGD